MPALTREELLVIERYYEENKAEVLEVDRQIRERNARRRNPPEIVRILKEARDQRMAMMWEFRRKRANGDGR